MRHKTRFACLFVVLVFCLAGCLESDPVVAPQSTEQTTSEVIPTVEEAQGSVTVPFRGKYATTFTPPTTPPPIIEFYIWGEGVATLFGKSTWEGPSSVDVTQVPPAQTSTAVFTAAEGSQITMVATGIGLPGPDPIYDVAFEGTFILVDGTGRFAGATGSGVYQGVASNSLAVGRITYDGTITMPRPPTPPSGP